MIRRWVRYTGLVLGMLFCVPLHYLWKLVGAKSPWPRRFLFWVGWVSGLRIRVEGTYRRTNCLFVANHASWLDILAIGGTAGAAFVAKIELSEVAFIKWLADFNDTIYIARQDRRAMQGHVDAVREALERGRAVCIFPEATTKGGKDVLPFRPSLLSSLYPPIEGLVVQPIVLDYGAIAEEIAWGEEDGGTNLKRIFARAGTIPLTMRYLEPITPGVGAGADRKILAATAHRQIVDALHGGDGPPSGEASTPLYAG